MSNHVSIKLQSVSEPGFDGYHEVKVIFTFDDLELFEQVLDNFTCELEFVDHLNDEEPSSPELMILWIHSNQLDEVLKRF